MAVDGGSRNNRRQMRTFQKLASDALGSLSLIEGDGITFVGDQISIDLNSPSPGLSLTGGLGIDLAPGSNLILTPAGLAVDPAAIPSAITAVAGETISALQIIYFDGSGARVAHASDFGETAATVGIAKTSATSGNSFGYQASGELTDGSWSWTPGASLYLSDLGVLSETPGTHVRNIAVAISATKININLLVSVRR